MKTVKVNYDKKGNAYLDIKDLKDLVDTKKITHYTIEVIDDESDLCAMLKFFDKNGKVVNVKESKK